VDLDEPAASLAASPRLGWALQPLQAVPCRERQRLVRRDRPVTARAAMTPARHARRRGRRKVLAGKGDDGGGG
jgi:hypothetical protein